MYIRWRPHACLRWVSASLLPSLYFHSLFFPFIHPKRMLFESILQSMDRVACCLPPPPCPPKKTHAQARIHLPTTPGTSPPSKTSVGFPREV